MRHDVYYYFDRACRRQAQAGHTVPSVNPAHWVAYEDLTAGFDVHAGEPGRIGAVEYRCTTCVTLVAMCEHIAEDLRGAPIERGLTLSAKELLSKHPEIPAIRHTRAQLAIDAAKAALKEIYL